MSHLKTEHEEERHFETDIRNNSVPTICISMGIINRRSVFDGDWTFCGLFHIDIHSNLCNIREILSSNRLNMKELKDARWKIVTFPEFEPEILGFKEMKKRVKPIIDDKRRWKKITSLDIGQTWTLFNMSGKSTFTRID